ncbi:long-chain-fatty-acid--CoA ligase [Bradyrhizobium liaoningense]|uniref:long-chain-fatty-acid--CoA ligase n=1 Tax=Bradyrhizobium liaoningense TaxID=43992 RepID=UPI001BAB3C4E|nr:long-chain-fatty-acid--CoA ligase [Bradyrhizobium liaoningense]MBR0858058.1 long-chain-fatty-acid--CoA ligase [Bradyrhizobium liaoningense]
MPQKPRNKQHQRPCLNGRWAATGKWPGNGRIMMLFHHPFDFHALNRGNTCFSLFEGQTQTYRSAYERSLAMAAAMQREGVKAGDRIALLKRNSPDYLVLILAISRIGAVVVPLNYRLAPGEWIDLVTDAGAVMIIADHDFALQWDHRLVESERDIPITRLSIDQVPGGWRTLLATMGGNEKPESHDQPGQDDTLIQMYTSGTTGKAKGALLSHSALNHNIAQNCCALPYRLNPNERMLAVLPLFHIAAIATVFGAIATGATLVIHRDVDPKAIARSLADDEIAGVCLVPAIIQFLLVGVPGIENMRFPALKYMGYGASPIAEPLLRKTLDVFKCDVAQGYGMTEMAGVATVLTEADHVRALRERPNLLLSAGKPVPGTEMRIVDPEGHDLPPGEIGEVLLRGGQMMSGYWNMPEATEKALADGWLRTGDAGVLDEEGYLFLRDRVKDMIISGAENIYPVEIEAILFRHPAIADVSVIGVPDERWGEAVMAVIVSRAGVSPTASELDAFCREHLGGFKVPKHYSFVEALPRNAAGKVLKKELRDRYWQGRERAIG